MVIYSYDLHILGCLDLHLHHNLWKSSCHLWSVEEELQSCKCRIWLNIDLASHIQEECIHCMYMIIRYMIYHSVVEHTLDKKSKFEHKVGKPCICIDLLCSNYPFCICFISIFCENFGHTKIWDLRLHVIIK